MAFGFGACVVPKDSGPKRFTGGIKEDSAVHLAGKADAPDRGHFQWMARSNSVQCAKRGLPPVPRRLFTPAGMRSGDIERLGVAGTNSIRVIHKHDFNA